MSNVSYKILERRQKLQIKAYLVLCIILLLSMGFYTYKKWEEYSISKTGVEQNKEFITLLREKVTEEKANYEEQKDSFTDLDKTISDKLEMIFPSKDDYTGLTRQFDIYEKQLNKRNNPFEISTIDYQQPIVKEELTYSVLPLRMSIKSSRENFKEFLHLIENSGSFDEEVRLMDISSIRLSFPQSDSEEETQIQFSIQLNAYFQK